MKNHYQNNKYNNLKNSKKENEIILNQEILICI